MSRCVLRLFHCIFKKTALIKSGAVSVLIVETIGYMTVGSVPTVDMILYVPLKSSTTLLSASASFSYLAYNVLNGMIRPFSFLLNFDKLLLQITPVVGGACWSDLKAAGCFLLIPKKRSRREFRFGQLS